MTGLRGDRWTASNRPEPSRAHGRGRSPSALPPQTTTQHRLVPPREDPPPQSSTLPIRTHPSHRSGGLVAQSAVAPPGPIPNPVVTHRSAGEYCGVAPREARPLRAPPIGRTSVRKSEASKKRPCIDARPFAVPNICSLSNVLFEYRHYFGFRTTVEAIDPHVFDAGMLRVVDSFACAR